MRKTLSKSHIFKFVFAIFISFFHADVANAQSVKIAGKLDNYYDYKFVQRDAKSNSPIILSTNEVAAKFSQYDVIFFGEFHGHSGVHFAQMQLFNLLFKKKPKISLSMEQFETDTQPVLDEYLAGKIGEYQLIKNARAWENYKTSYRPLVSFAKANKLKIIAAEAPTWAISCIGQNGIEILDKFTSVDRSFVASEINLQKNKYYDKYNEFLKAGSGHGAKGDTEEAKLKSWRSFQAQASRDDTMAQSIANALAKYPQNKVFHINGNFHSQGFMGTIERLKLRNPNLKIALIEPVEMDNPNALSIDIGILNKDSVALLVYPTPETFVENEDMSKLGSDFMAKRKTTECKYSPTLEKGILK